jgi:hypothetical protein
MEALIRNLKLLQRLRGFLKTFSLELKLFWSDARLFQRIRGYFKLLPYKWRLFPEMWGILNNLRLFEDIFREIREMEALKRNLRFFQRLQGFLKTFFMKLRLFEVM